jgi:hypothetical protein
MAGVVVHVLDLRHGLAPSWAAERHADSLGGLRSIRKTHGAGLKAPESVNPPPPMSGVKVQPSSAASETKEPANARFQRARIRCGL